MAATVTIADLIQAGLETADVEKSNNYSAAEKLRIVNESVSYVYDFLVTSWGDAYFASSTPFSVPSGQRSVQLSTIADSPSLYKELGITRTQDGAPQTIYPLAGFVSRNDCAERRYWLAGQEISFWPQTPGWDHSGTYTLDFVPDVEVFTSTTSTLPAELVRWRALVVVTAAIKFLTKRKQDTSDMERRQAKLEAAIVVAATSRKKEPRKLRVNRNHDQYPLARYRRI